MQTTNPAQFRRAIDSDQPELTTLMQAFSIEVGAPLSETHISNALKPLLENPSIGEIWVAADPEILGYLVMSWGWGIESGGSEALIDEVYVTPEARGSMVATGLVQAALDSAQIRGTRAIFLETEADNPRSRKLYERLGFEVEPSMWMRRKI